MVSLPTKFLPEAYQKKIPLVTNGGGLNPEAAAQLVYETALKMGLHGLKIAYVTGDDVSGRLEELIDAGGNTGKP